MLPVAISLVVAAVAFGRRESEPSSRARRTSQVLAGAAVAALLANVWAAGIAGFDTADGRRFFNSPEFLGSEVIAEAVELRMSVDVFSNIPDGLWYAGAGGARALPVVVDPLTLQRSQRLQDELSSIGRFVDEADSVILYQRGSREYMIDESAARLLAPCVVLDDGDHVLLAGSSSTFCP